MNVLFYDGSVQRKTPSDIDPYDEANGLRNLTTLWKPDLGGCQTACGLEGVYYSGDGSGEGVTRVDPSIHLPFGNAAFFGVPYDIPLEGATFNNPWPLKTGKWTGQIKADKSASYIFQLSCDNEATLFIDGSQVLHRVAGGAWGVQQYQASSSVPMEAGKWVDIEVRWKEYHAGTPSHISVKWQSDSGPVEQIPSCNLRPSTTGS